MEHYASNSLKSLMISSGMDINFPLETFTKTHSVSPETNSLPSDTRINR